MEGGAGGKLLLPSFSELINSALQDSSPVLQSSTPVQLSSPPITDTRLALYKTRQVKGQGKGKNKKIHVYFTL